MIRVLALALLVCMSGSACSQAKKLRERQNDPNLGAKILDAGWNNADPFVRCETLELVSHAPESAWVSRATGLLEDAEPLVALVAAKVLLGTGAKASALEKLKKTSVASNEEAALTALAIGFKGLSYEDYLDLAKGALRSSLSAVRRAAIRGLIDTIQKGKTPDASQARSLEQYLMTFATDADLGVVIAVLEYLGSEGRLTDQNEAKRQALYELARTGAATDQVRAMRILTGLADPKLKEFAFDLYLRSEKVPELAELHDLAIVAVGQSGDSLRIPELDRLTVRELDTDMQILALSALSRIDDPEASLSLGQALESPKAPLRRYVLEQEMARPRQIRVSDVLLKDPDLEVRVLALKTLYRQDATRFERTVTQKLSVEQYRLPLLRALVAWLEESNADAPWLKGLMPTLRKSVDEFGQRWDLSGPLLELITAVDGPDGFIDQLDDFAPSGQYAVLRATLDDSLATPEQYHEATRSPYFAVQLVGAVGLLIPR